MVLCLELKSYGRNKAMKSTNSLTMPLKRELAGAVVRGDLRLSMVLAKIVIGHYRTWDAYGKFVDARSKPAKRD